MSSDGGREPVWSADGRTLFYRSGDRMMSVAITITPVFRSGTPLEIWRKAYFSQQLMTTNYDVAADGRFLMLRVPDERGGTMATVSVILNWRKELKDRGLVR